MPVTFTVQMGHTLSEQDNPKLRLIRSIFISVSPVLCCKHNSKFALLKFILQGFVSLDPSRISSGNNSHKHWFGLSCICSVPFLFEAKWKSQKPWQFLFLLLLTPVEFLPQPRKDFFPNPWAALLLFTIRSTDKHLDKLHMQEWVPVAIVVVIIEASQSCECP